MDFSVCFKITILAIKLGLPNKDFLATKFDNNHKVPLRLQNSTGRKFFSKKLVHFQFYSLKKQFKFAHVLDLHKLNYCAHKVRFQCIIFKLGLIRKFKKKNEESRTKDFF